MIVNCCTLYCYIVSKLVKQNETVVHFHTRILNVVHIFERSSFCTSYTYFIEMLCMFFKVLVFVALYFKNTIYSLVLNFSISFWTSFRTIMFHTLNILYKTVYLKKGHTVAWYVRYVSPSGHWGLKMWRCFEGRLWCVKSYYR